MSIFGRAINVHFVDCRRIPATAEGLEKILTEAAATVGATPLGAVRHDFSPQGATVTVALAESHYAAHTWPERGAVVATFHTCGEIDSWQAVMLTAKALGARKISGSSHDYDDGELQKFMILFLPET